MNDDATARVGVVTGHRAPDLSADGKRVAGALADRGFAVDPVMWDDASVDWNGYDAAVVRSCWDYPDDVERFRELLAELERTGTVVCNPLAVIRWNLHKSYVVELAEAGVPVPDTTVVERGSDADLGAALDRLGIDGAVVKPAIGTSSRDVWRVTRRDDGSLEADGADDPQHRFASMLADGDVIVQAFVPDVAGGERSIVFFDGEYSHAWNSTVAPDDFTAFEDHDADYEPGSGIRSRAAEVLRTARAVVGRNRPLPYARVDYVEPGGELLLLELELIEPYLGLERGDGTVQAFASALAGRIRREVTGG